MIDEKYTNLLKANNSLSLKECLWLDAVQKHHPITKEAAKHLQYKSFTALLSYLHFCLYVQTLPNIQTAFHCYPAPSAESLQTGGGAGGV